MHTRTHRHTCLLVHSDSKLDEFVSCTTSGGGMVLRASCSAYLEVKPNH